jgi:hypothetical protein
MTWDFTTKSGGIWKILVNQWRNESSSREQLGHHLGFTKSDEEPGCCGELWAVAMFGQAPSSLPPLATTWHFA